MKITHSFHTQHEFALALCVCVFCCCPIFQLYSCWFWFSHCWFYKWPKMDTILYPMGLHYIRTYTNKTSHDGIKNKKKTIQTAGHPLHNGYLFNKKSHNVFFVCLFVMRLVFLNACMCMCCACLSFQGLWIVFMFAIVCFPRRAPWTMASVRCFYLDFWVYVIETWAYTIHICPCNL